MRKDYSSLSEEKKTEFGLSLKSLSMNLGSGKSGSSEQQHSKFCGDYRTLTTRTSRENWFSSKMHDKAIDAWRTCIQTTQRQLFVDFETPTNERYTDISMKYTGPAGPVRFNGVELYQMTCTSDGKPVDAGTKFALSPASKALHCERKSLQQTIGGVQSNYYPPAGLTIKTDAGNSSYEFVEMIDGPAREKFRQVETQISKVAERADNSLETFSNFLSSKWSLQKETILARTEASPNVLQERKCDEGQYVVGLRVQGGLAAHCNGCVAHTELICRPLPKLSDQKAMDVKRTQ